MLVLVLVDVSGLEAGRCLGRGLLEPWITFGLIAESAVLSPTASMPTAVWAFMTSENKRFPLSAAAIAGTLDNIVTYPIEFVKTQLQLQVRSSARGRTCSAQTVCQRRFL